MKLYADNLNQFIIGERQFYTVQSSNYKRGDVVTLYDNHQEHEFKIYTAVHWGGNTILGLGAIMNAEIRN